jgi:hypothetical protein
VLLVCLLALALANSPWSTCLSGAFGCITLYFMINPAKASYSIAPTMVICAIGGYFTAALFNSVRLRTKLTTAALVGLLLGISVAFRIPNLLLSAGYFTVFLACFLVRRQFSDFMCGGMFGICYLIGLIPNLLANTVNAGSPFATTYSAVDVVAPYVSFSVVQQYLTDTQGVLILVGATWTICSLILSQAAQIRTAVLVTGVNLLLNLAFFFSHPLYTQYYLMPIAMLSLWTLLFDYLMGAQGAIPAVAE